MHDYQLIYCDPPWQYGNKASNGAAVNHYSTMSLTDLKRLPVWSLAAPNAVLAMWYTGNFNDEAKQLAELKALPPVAWHTEDHDTDKTATTYSQEIAERWKCKGWPITELFTAAKPVNVATIQDELIEQVGVMCDQATNTEEKNVYGHAYCVFEIRNTPLPA